MKVLKYTLIVFIAIYSTGIFAQYDYPGEDENDKETNKPEKKGWYRDSKIFFGGVPGLMFGSVTYIEIPLYVGYKITPAFWAGTGPIYQYYKDNTIGYESTIYGGKVFTQLFLIKNLEEKIKINLGDIFIYCESSMLNIQPYYIDPKTYLYYKAERKWINVTLIGFGIRYPIGYRSGFSLNVLWDITQNPEYSYPNPEIRIGFDL
jgi:hypothetical protein